MGMKKADIPLPPSLPKTTVANTPAPGGEAPIKAAVKVGVKDVVEVVSALQPRNLSDYQKPWLPQEVARNDRRAVLEHVLSSPAYAQLVVGKREEEAFAIGSRMFEYFFAKFNEAKASGPQA